MFGIKDPLILLPYMMGAACLIFSAWYGLKYWNKDDQRDKDDQSVKNNQSNLNVKRDLKGKEVNP